MLPFATHVTRSVVCVSVCEFGESGWADREVVWGADSFGPVKPLDSGTCWRHLANTIERLMRGAMRQHAMLLWPLVIIARYTINYVTVAEMELGHWVTGSPGHHFDPVWDPNFSGFRKNAQNAKRTFKMLKWQKSLSGVCCWTEITGCQSMQ